MPAEHDQKILQNLTKLLLILATLPIVGTASLMAIEDWGFLDSLYMSVITLSTVGFQEVRPLSDPGRIFIICYLIVGLGGFLYAVVQIGEIVVRTELSGIFGRRNMDRTIKELKNHYIICGVGRVGMRIGDYLSERKIPFIAIETDRQTLELCTRKGWKVIAGDATDDQVLQSAGIENAKGVCTVLSTDADNVYVVLSARLLSKGAQIISRGSNDKAVDKLKRAGANHVVSLYETGASKMAHLLANEKMENFMEIFKDNSGEVDLVELKMGEDGEYVGRTLATTDFTAQGIIIVAIRQSSGELQIPPSAKYEISAGDSLIAIGKEDKIAQLTRAA